VWTVTLNRMSTVAERLTADEYLRRDDLSRWAELIDGVIVMASPSLTHQRACKRILDALTGWSTTGGHGEATLPLDVRTDDHNVPCPDVSWFAEPPPDDTPRGAVSPDLVVEVRSPSTWHYDTGRKRELYEQHGVRELWLVDPSRRTVLACRRSGPGRGFDQERKLGAGEQLTSPLLPGFRLAVDQIFGS
jgi:Uma2 family endonuclease